MIRHTNLQYQAAELAFFVLLELAGRNETGSQTHTIYKRLRPLLREK